ncbi:hypothetical protein [Spiroplasma endosymbiont of Virgichneumon dumeticola]|uniref:hypothetical protein n=1 Tax=Spiroplasma endosymbiont of Virgichneumon dumeticola TaxID=3139323 RepID=UPI0035C94093
MFNITTGVILKIDAYFPNRNITILTDNSGIKVVSLSNLQQYFHNYYILDVWTFIVSNNKNEVWIPYEQLSSFKQLLKNRDILKLIYYFNNRLLPTCTCGGNNEIEWVQ